MRNTVTKKLLTGAALVALALTNASGEAQASEISALIHKVSNVKGTLLATSDLGGIRGFNSSSVLTDVFSGSGTASSVKPTETIKLRGERSLTDEVIPVTLSLRDSDVTQVLRMFADKAGLNIIFDPNVSGNVTLDLVDVPMNDAFELIMEMNQLFYLIDNNTLIVYADAENSTLHMKELIAIPVQYVDAAPMATFLNQNIFGLKKPGLSATTVATTNPRKNEILIFGTQNDAAMARKIVNQFDTKPEFKTYKVNHVTPDVMAEMICTQLLPTIIDMEGSRRGSIGHITGAAAKKGDGLSIGGGEIACGYTSGTKSKSGGRRGGVELSSLPLLALEVSYSPGLGTINIMGATPQQFTMIEDFIKKNDIKEPQAYLEISIIELNEDGSKTFDNAWAFSMFNFEVSFSNGNTTVGGNDPTGNTIGSGAPIYLVDHRKDPKSFHPTTLSWVLKYLVENSKGRVVANPKILITNGQESTIDLTSDYVKTVTSQVVQGVQQATSQKDYEIGDDNGIKVELTPFISPDGYVTLDITPDYATISGQEYSVNKDTQERELVATLLQRRNLELKKVRIKDGETLIIGGMLRDEETKNVAKFPVLGDLPYIGALFRSTTTQKTKSEMIIMITPKIIVDNDDAISEQESL